MTVGNTLKAGDSVYIGEPSPEKVLWKITLLHHADAEHTYATIRSGLSGRSWIKPVEALTLHSKGKK